MLQGSKEIDRYFGLNWYVNHDINKQPDNTKNNAENTNSTQNIDNKNKASIPQNKKKSKHFPFRSLWHKLFFYIKHPAYYTWGHRRGKREHKAEDLLKGKKLKGAFLNLRHPIYWTYDYGRKRRRPFHNRFHNPSSQRDRVESAIYRNYFGIRFAVALLYKILPRWLFDILPMIVVGFLTFLLGYTILALIWHTFWFGTWVLPHFMPQYFWWMPKYTAYLWKFVHFNPRSPLSPYIKKGNALDEEFEECKKTWRAKT